MATENTSSQTICVYCGASSNVQSIYKEAAQECGSSLAMANMTVVYGGGRIGLMGLLADSALKSGGRVIGIIPAHIQDREPQHHSLTELQIVESMHDRKALMEKQSDGFLILPGGFGTMDETFEIMTWKMLRLHDKPIVLLNTHGYWDPFIALVNNIIDEGFAQEKDRNFIVLNTMAEVIGFFQKSIEK